MTCKRYSHFSSKSTYDLDIVLTRTVNIITTNELVKLKNFWTTGPWCFCQWGVDFRNPGHTLLPTFPSFRPMGMVGEACLPSNAYYSRTPDYTLYSGDHVCWSENSDSSFVYGFMSLGYGLGTMTITAFFVSWLVYYLSWLSPQVSLEGYVLWFGLFIVIFYTILLTMIELGFNDTSTLVGHFVSSPREREKIDRRDSRRDEREGQGRKRNRNESEETKEIKTSPPYPYLLQG